MDAMVPEGYKKTKLGYIPKEWEIDSLSKVLKPVIREIEKPNEPYWRLGLRSHGKGTFHEFVEDPNSVSMDKLYVVEEDDLIVNITFAWEHAIALATKKDKNKLVSHRFPTYQFTNNNSPLFYKYYVLQPRFKYELENISPGGAGRNRVMSKTDFLKIDVLIPSSNEQTKIAQILTTWDEVIVKQEGLIKEKEQLKKGLMQKLLSGEVRFDGFHEDWQEVKIMDILSIGSGKDYKHLNNGNIPVYGTGGQMLMVDDYLYDGESVCIGRKGTIDKPQFLNGKFWTVDTLFYTHSYINTLPKFIFYIFQLINWYKYNEASGVPSLSKRTIEIIKLKLPSLIEQQKIAEVLSLADDEINLLKKELEELKLQKKALMQKLLTGQVRVKV